MLSHMIKERNYYGYVKSKVIRSYEPNFRIKNVLKKLKTEIGVIFSYFHKNKIKARATIETVIA